MKVILAQQLKLNPCLHAREQKEDTRRIVLMVLNTTKGVRCQPEIRVWAQEGSVFLSLISVEEGCTKNVRAKHWGITGGAVSDKSKKKMAKL